MIITWELLPQAFIKVNFDGSLVRNSGGAGFVIHGLNAGVVATRGSHLFDISVLGAESRAACAGIIYARRILQAYQLIRGWTQSWMEETHSHPVLHDISRILMGYTLVIVAHVYHEVSNVAN